MTAPIVQFRVLADYECHPLWLVTSEGIRNVDPQTSAASPDLAADLVTWGAAFDETLDRDDPPSSGFGSPAEERQFVGWGRELAARLAAELSAEVEYFNVSTAAYESVAPPSQ